jgi:phage repressor protein C with HTH and peptisase S24 domain
MFTHEEVWRGIDRLARHHGLTASGLARRAGLDPTTFNPSKRITKEDKPRWPSTESLAKILTATTTPFSAFVAMMSDEAGAKIELPSQRMRCVALTQAHRATLFDQAGFPVGGGWDEIDFPNLDDRHAYAIEIHGDAMAPIYRDGDLLIVSPGANIRRHDRVLLKPIKGDVIAGLLLRRTAQRIELAPFAGSQETKRVAVGDVAWLARIVWASQ